MIKVENLHKNFGKNQVLKGVDLEISEGELFAILGPNGSGKTTLIKSLLGMVLPTSGSIKFENKPIKNNWRYRNKIDYLPQIANFPSNLTVMELIKMIKNIRNKDITDEKRLLNLFNLESVLNQNLGSLSGGTKQKVNIVLAFMFDSQVMILDEPTSGLDPIALIHLKQLISSEKEKGKTIIITSHIMSFVEEVATDILFLLEGKIYFKGSITALKKKTGQENFEHAIASILENNYV